MAGTNQKAWLIATIELAPTLIFLSLWKSGIPLETAGWSGTVAAATALMALAIMRADFSPVMLGINIHLLLITPVIVSLYKLGLESVAIRVQEQAQTLIFVVVAVVGAILTRMTHRGFIGCNAGNRALRQRYSLYLLIPVLAAIPWAYLHAGSTLTSIGLPLALLFAFRGYLAARLDDKDSKSEAGTSIAAAGTLDNSY